MKNNGFPFTKKLLGLGALTVFVGAVGTGLAAGTAQAVVALPHPPNFVNILDPDHDHDIDIFNHRGVDRDFPHVVLRHHLFGRM
jgi:hypothetical protein